MYRVVEAESIAPDVRRIVVEAPRDEPAVLVADLDLDQQRDWQSWGLFQTRRPDQYVRLAEPEPPA